jgi:hypothetical protein
MKYLRIYNESIRDLMTPKSEEEILKSLKKLDNSDILRKSITNNFVKGVEIALQNELTENDIKFIKEIIYFVKNKEIIKLILEKVRNELSLNDIFFLEKYIFGLHQSEEKEYEKWFINILKNIEIKPFNKYNINTQKIEKDYNFMIYFNSKKQTILLYDKLSNRFKVNYDLIYRILIEEYNLNVYQITLLIKYLIEKYLNLKNIKIYHGVL